jgi:hypothetical protein
MSQPHNAYQQHERRDESAGEKQTGEALQSERRGRRVGNCWQCRSRAKPFFFNLRTLIPFSYVQDGS